MSSNMVAILSAVVVLAFSYLPKIIHFLFPNASDSQAEQLIELLTQLLQFLFGQFEQIIK